VPATKFDHNVLQVLRGPPNNELQMLRLLSILILTCFKQQVCHEKGTESAGQLSLQHVPTLATRGFHNSYIRANKNMCIG
jgi:hypothetical protein